MYDNSSLSLPLAQGFVFDHQVVNELIPIAGIILAGVITVSAMYFSHHQKKMVHDTARLALEKGLPLSPEFLASLSSASAKSGKGARNDIRTGLILIAVGIGMIFFMRFMDELRFMGAIPGLVGIVLLLYGTLEPIFSQKQRKPDARGAPP